MAVAVKTMLTPGTLTDTKHPLRIQYEVGTKKKKKHDRAKIGVAFRLH